MSNTNVKQKHRRMNAIYAQSGGVTAVINASACGLIETANQHRDRIGKVLAAHNGIVGVLKEELIDTSRESPKNIAALRWAPGGSFGSCRHKLKSLDAGAREYQRIIQVFKAHNIGFFFYNGGGDSQDTLHKVAQIGDRLGYPVTCIGIPKTVDNDLPFTDTCPGFGSVAKYVAVSIREASMDVASMYCSSTKVFVMEVMGRHAGWIAAAAGLAQKNSDDAPHLILFPEIAFQRRKFLRKVKATVKRVGYCVIVVSEGTRTTDGTFLADAGGRDAFGHTQLGGVAPTIAAMIKDELGLKYHWGVADYLQRSARHIASKVDVDQAYAMGQAAVEMAVSGKNCVMPIIVRKRNKPYRWEIGEVALEQVANVEKTMPRDFITAEGFGITEKARRYLAPLIEGEDYPPYKNGLPQYVTLKKRFVTKKLKEWKMGSG